MGIRSIFVYDEWGMESLEAEDSLFSTACSRDEIYDVKPEEVNWYDLTSNYLESDLMTQYRINKTKIKLAEQAIEKSKFYI